jgi:multiple sugar transport system substrate-binding protein
MNSFQTILVSVFLAFFVFAVLIFSGLLKIGGSSSTTTGLQGKITIWGTFNNPDIFKVFDDMRTDNRDLTIRYVIKKESSYQQDLIEAFASGTGPDLFFITPDMVLKNKPYVFKIPYTSYPEKTFKDSFIDGADVYTDSEGIIGFPFVVDPIVMYYNKDILSNEGISTPPQYWDELFALNSQLTKKKNDGTIMQSMIGLGRYDNVSHAKDILATLLMQSGNNIVAKNGSGYTTILNENPQALPTSPIESILNFFITFSNPTSDAYSWNRALPNSIDMFTGGKLAFYLGRASELFKIQSVNPNLSFDVAPILQTKGTNLKRTYGNIYAVAVNKKSTNPTTAFSVAGLISTGDTAKNLAISASLPPASRALLKDKPTDPYLFTFFNSAIIARSWIDPQPVTTNTIFGELIQNILSNKLSMSDAINKAQSQIESLIQN